MVLGSQISGLCVIDVSYSYPEQEQEMTVL